MKHFLIIAGIIMLLSSTSANANEDNSYPGFLTSFFKTFSKAEKVNWKQVDGFTRIEFQINGKINFAYYNADNSLVVVTTPARLSDLPEELRSGLSQQYKNFSPMGVYECTTGKRKAFYVVLEKGRKQLVVTSRGKKWQVLSSSTK